MPHLIPTPYKQKGIATLMVSIMILIVLGLMTLYTNRSAIIEQRSATNEFKQAQALEAAQSGMATLMGQLGSTDTTKNWSNYFTQSGSTFTLKTSFQNNLNNNGYLNAANNTFSNNFTSTKIAISDTLPWPKDDEGTTISGIAQTYKVFLANTSIANKFKLIVQGCADTCDYAEAFTMTDFSVTQSAICPLDINGALTVTNNSSIHGLVNGVPGFNCGITVGSASGTLGDVIGCSSGSCNAGDGGNFNPPYTVSGSTGKDAHFQKYWGTSQTAQLNQMKTGSTATPKTACFFNADANQADLTACVNAGISNIYVTGNLNITSSTSWLGIALPTGMQIIVGGDLVLQSSASPPLGTTFGMAGFLYVVGNTTSSLGGALHMLGTAAFAGNVTGNVSLNVTADTRYSNIPAGGGVTSNLTVGSWRDF